MRYRVARQDTHFWFFTNDRSRRAPWRRRSALPLRPGGSPARQRREQTRVGDFAEARRWRRGRYWHSDSRGSERGASALLEFDPGVGAYAEGSTRSAFAGGPPVSYPRKGGSRGGARDARANTRVGQLGLGDGLVSSPLVPSRADASAVTLIDRLADLATFCRNQLEIGDVNHTFARLTEPTKLQTSALEPARRQARHVAIA